MRVAERAKIASRMWHDLEPEVRDVCIFMFDNIMTVIGANACMYVQCDKWSTLFYWLQGSTR